MNKVKNIVSELKDDVNEKFVNVCSVFYKKLQIVDDEIVNKILNHEANKIIKSKLYNLSKYIGDYNIY